MLSLLNLLSAVALLVWGRHIVRTGILRVYRSQLRRILSQSMGNLPLAFLAGLGVTALALQLIVAAAWPARCRAGHPATDRRSANRTAP